LAGEPTIVSAEAVVGPPGIDVTMTALLEFPSDVTARIHCSMARGLEFRAALDVRGTRGRVVAENPIAPQYGYELVVTPPAGDHAETVADGTSYGFQLEAFADAVLEGKRPITSGADSIANMRAIDAIYRAAGLSPRGGSSLQA